MDYWLDLFTGQTWNEFRKSGATVSGFNKRMRKTVANIQPGDILLCYMTGVMRWVGALEVVGQSGDQTSIWSDAEFAARLSVKPLILLDAECGVPMSQLEGRVEFFESNEDKGKFKGFVRRSPSRFKREQDGRLILGMLQEAERNPVPRPVDPRKFSRKPLLRAELRKGRKTVSTGVSVPDAEDAEMAVEQQAERDSTPATTRHTEIQSSLLQLGIDMGLDAWVARNDRGKVYDGQTLGEIPGIVSELPTQFNEATQRTIELIDVLWLSGNSIVAAFEVECTTSVYSGLLRMSDLLALQPNLDIKLYLVAPDERRSKVEGEILRPTFKLREKPLSQVCGFLPFSTLMQKVDGIRKLGLAESLKPDFLVGTAEYFDEEAEP